MNDFFMASNRPIKVGELSVHQLQMHNFDEWSSVAQVIKDFLNSIGSDKLYMDTPPELEGLSNRK